MPVEILKRPSIPVSSDVRNTSLNSFMKNVTLRPYLRKLALLGKFRLLCLLLPRMTRFLNLNNFAKPNVHLNETNRGKDARNTVVQKSTKSLKQNFE